MRRLATWAYRALLLAVVLCAVAATVSAPPSAPGSSASTPDGPESAPPSSSPQLRLAADTSQFDPGHIISDAVFYDSRTMNAGQVQSFLDSRGANCRIGNDGSACLKNYRMNTSNRAADSLCSGYQGAAGESAATIIVKVSLACEVNPQVLLVLLQKEMGLIASTNPTAKMYDRAAGYACPDIGNGWCDPAYAGLQNQLYRSAWQYQRYAAYPKNYAYQAGRNNEIQWSPSAGCGSSTVYIHNQATAGLYIYTPYRPNAAALGAGYGRGDGCSAYGNRNFWLYFTDWFGTTGVYTTSGAIGAVWNAEGGGSGHLGHPASPMVCNLTGGGCAQHFQTGSIYWSPSTGARSITGAVRAAYAAQSWERGGLGYPMTNMDCTLPSGGCVQYFLGGQIMWTASTGARAMTTGMARAWHAAGGLNAWLGYPVADQVCGLAAGGCRQDFQGGNVYWSPSTGEHAMVGGIRAFWLSRGGETGALGYPTGDIACDAVGCSQAFSGGKVGWTSAGGNRVVTGAIGARWAAAGFGSSRVGYPVSDMTCGLAGGGCRQDFQYGWIYWSPAGGAWQITGDVGAAWVQQGADTAPSGYPTGDPTCTASGCQQSFQRAQLAGSGTVGVHALSGAIGARWTLQGGSTGALGFPTGGMTCRSGPESCQQDFQNGSIHWSPTSGAHAVSGNIRSTWVDQGGFAGGLGFPIEEATCGLTDGGCRQPFQGGTLYWSAGSGGHAVSGAIGWTWTTMGAERGGLGFPVAAMTCVTDGCSQQFRTGYLTWTASTGVRIVNGAVGQLWGAHGGASGGMRFPTGNLECGLVGGGCRQTFQGATAYWSPASGARAVYGAIASGWAHLGGERGSLGYPVADMACTSTACSQQFQGGHLVWSPTRPMQVVSGRIGQLWATQGAIAGPLGVPTGAMTCPAGCTQSFENGIVVWSAATDAHAVSGPIRSAWSAAGGLSGTFGYPTTEPYAVPAGLAQDFQGGRLVLDSTSGEVTAS